MSVEELGKLSILDRCYYEAVKGALEGSGGQLAPAARRLGISLPTARKHAVRFGLWKIMPRVMTTKLLTIRALLRYLLHIMRHFRDLVIKIGCGQQHKPADPWLIDEGQEDRKSTRLNSSHIQKSRMPSSA